jgi:hypothetical protein
MFEGNGLMLMRMCVLLALTPVFFAPVWAQEAVGGGGLGASAEVFAVAQKEDSVPVEQPHGLYEELGSAGDWTAIRFRPVPDRSVCAIFSRPIDSVIMEGDNVIAALRGERAAFITWESGVVSETGGVFSAIIGAPLASPFDGHSFTTEGRTFKMFGHDDRLYAEAASDVEAIASIRKGMVLTVEAALPGGRVARDTYSLKGVVAATKLAASACKVSG